MNQKMINNFEIGTRYCLVCAKALTDCKCPASPELDLKITKICKETKTITVKSGRQEKMNQRRIK